MGVRFFVAGVGLLLAQSAMAQETTEEDKWPDGVGPTFSYLARKLEQRALDNCDPAVDAPELTAHRKKWMEVATQRNSAPQLTFEIMTAMALTNAAHFNVCFDQRLAGSGLAAAVYMNNSRVIALNPKLPEGEDSAAVYEDALARSYILIKRIFAAYGEQALTELDLARPQGLPLNGAENSGEIPEEAPRRQPEYRK